MSLRRFAASVTPGVIELACIEVSHSTWAAPQRRVQQPDDWTVTIENVSSGSGGGGAIP